MLLLDDQPDTFLLRIQNPSEQRELRKKEIVVRWSVTPDRGLTWQYLRHEFFERPALLSEWSLTESYQVRMTGGLQALIESQLEWEIWEEFTPPDPSNPNPHPRLGIDRRRLFGILLGWRMSRMGDPHSIAEAVYIVRQASGLGTNEFAAALGTNHATISFAESGKRGLSPSVIKKLEMMANRLMEWKVAEYLRSQSMVAWLNTTRRGGHR